MSWSLVCQRSLIRFRCTTTRSDTAFAVTLGSAVCERTHPWAGDVIGFPTLASTSMEQRRLAPCHMCGIPFEHTPDLFPYGIYTIPEISTVGQTEEPSRRIEFPTKRESQSILNLQRA